jgi:serine/threonine-protein kinase
MGEVYRADDLKLGQPVALKFLPQKLSDDPVRRERFFAEVRITRQLSHPNICRVYDIGEVDGRHFLSMEYIDGEDLASLMKRIGSLTNEKALDIARQLVAGLSVAHERGVLHRDLKPANIMLDGHGRVRITDFGLAIAAEDEEQVEEIAGTPAYMAPEQLAGKGATVRSDIYSLGLILYEIYTGKKAFKANTLAELREQKETQNPRAPSELREGIDPVVERVIQRCMEKDPNARPASVAQLAQALPGGDPLAAAIAAGETPSPEMVAASGSKEGLKPWIAWGLLTVIVLGLVFALIMKDRVSPYRRIPFEEHPEALAKHAQEIINKAGYTDENTNRAYGFFYFGRLPTYLEKTDTSSDRLKKLDGKTIFFWYRQSPGQFGSSGIYVGRLGPYNPQLVNPGEVLVVLDTNGHLVHLSVVPPLEASSSDETEEAPDWSVFFEEAGLNIDNWGETDALWNPRSYADTVTAWTGSFPNWPNESARIEAAAFAGKPVNFYVHSPFVSPGDTETAQTSIIELIGITGIFLFFIPATLGGIFFARRNLKLGRGDRGSAYKLAILVFALPALNWILQFPRVSFIDFLLLPYLAILAWIFYLAIEPFVRRRWPKVLISWTRLLSGKWRDPLVARDVLIGFAFGPLFTLILFYLRTIPSGWTPESSDNLFPLVSFLGARFTITSILSGLTGSIVMGLIALCLLMIMKVLVRNQIAAVILCIIIAAMAALLTNIGPIAALIYSTLFYLVLVRFGILAVILWAFANTILVGSPITLESSAWYSRYGYLGLTIFAAIVLYAFYTSFGGRPIFGTPRLDD